MERNSDDEETLTDIVIDVEKFRPVVATGVFLAKLVEALRLVTDWFRSRWKDFSQRLQSA